MDEWRPVMNQTSFDKSLSLSTLDDELLRLRLPEEATVGDVCTVETVVECWVRVRACWLILFAARLVFITTHLVLGQLLMSN